MNRKKESTYWKLQERKTRAEESFAVAVTSIKNQVNGSRANAEDFFSEAKEDGTRDVLMSASAVASANENLLLSKLTPSEAVNVFAVIGALKQGQAAPEETPAKIKLLAQLIIVGYQLSALPEEGVISTDAAFELQPQPDGSVVVGDEINPVTFPEEPAA